MPFFAGTKLIRGFVVVIFVFFPSGAFVVVASFLLPVFEEALKQRTLGLFYTSSFSYHVMIDLPFGMRSLMLSP